jgi:hypothetical protein
MLVAQQMDVEKPTRQIGADASRLRRAIAGAPQDELAQQLIAQLLLPPNVELG